MYNMYFNYNLTTETCSLSNESVIGDNVRPDNTNCGFTRKSNLFSDCEKQTENTPPNSTNIDPTATLTPVAVSNGSSSPNLGLVIGLIVALALLVFVLLAILFYCYRSKKKPEYPQMSSEDTLQETLPKPHHSQYHNQYLQSSQPTIVELPSSNSYNSYDYQMQNNATHNPRHADYEFKPLPNHFSNLGQSLSDPINRTKTFTLNSSKNDLFQPLELSFLERNKTFAPIRSNDEPDFPRFSLGQGNQNLFDNQPLARVDSFGRVNTLKNTEPAADSLSKPSTLKHRETLVTRISQPETPILEQNLPEVPVSPKTEDNQPRYQIQ
ncbi:hypothetical protein HDV01_006597 [Terramyces sp. JEL0728]|nr:hypothetical protein HDV01_006597 [Terramyces sp. JEL0728]